MGRVVFCCTDKEKEAIESMAKKSGMTPSLYCRMRVMEPRVPKKKKGRNMAAALMEISELIESRNPLLTDKDKLEYINKEVKKIWEAL